MRHWRASNGVAVRYNVFHGRRPEPHARPAFPRRTAEFLASADPARHHRRVAVHPAGRDRPDRGGAGGARHRRRPARVRPPVVDRLGLSAHLHRRHADLWPAFGHLRAAGAAAAGDRAVRDRLRPVRAVAVAVATDRVPGVAGRRRGGADGDGAGLHRRRRCAARAGQISGLHGRHLASRFTHLGESVRMRWSGSIRGHGGR